MVSATQLVPQQKKCRVLLVDDHPIVRQGLALLIDREPDLSVCGEADGSHSAFHAIATLLPDIVVLDISLSGPDGLDVLCLCSFFPCTMNPSMRNAPCAPARTATS
jgi:CheY-like chemotaxis protein